MNESKLGLTCACGSFRGEFIATSRGGARGICHCDDCQAYARFLAPASFTDENGGTEVIQTWPSNVRFTHGHENLRLIHLSPGGLHRFFAECCRTPIANSLGNSLPFIGLVVAAIDKAHTAELDAIFGTPHGVQGRFVAGGVPPGVHPSAPLGVIVSALSLLARGWWHKKSKPSPVFDADGQPVVVAQVLTPAERAALNGS
jgi:hypothetical protein